MLEADTKLEEYRVVRTAASRRVKEVMAKAQPLSVVADTVLQAATAAHPKLRYTPGMFFKVMLRFSLRTFGSGN
jgi:hypothetical protein